MAAAIDRFKKPSDNGRSPGSKVEICKVYMRSIFRIHPARSRKCAFSIFTHMGFSKPLDYCILISFFFCWDVLWMRLVSANNDLVRN